MVHQASAEDRRFIEVLEAFQIAPGEFDHCSHLRMAYTYLCDHDAATAMGKVRTVIHGLLTHQGIDPASKYHETMTQAWILAVRHFMYLTPSTASAQEFLRANPRLLNSKIMDSHYSNEVLHSSDARTGFVAPDLAPIPQHDALPPAP